MDIKNEQKEFIKTNVKEDYNSDEEYLIKDNEEDQYIKDENGFYTGY